MKTIEKIKNHSWWIIMLLLIVVFFKQCGINREISRTNKEIKEISNEIDSIHKSFVTEKQMEKSLRRTMFDFLIYEDDFDKGKASLSDIKSKIENDK
jgi:hypothetical protein